MASQKSSGLNQRQLYAALGGCGSLAVCLCFVAAVAGGAYYFISNRQAQGSEPTVEYILDASPRMLTPVTGGTRLSVAQDILAEIVRAADPTMMAGLRVFGTGTVAQGCQDTHLLIPLAQQSHGQIADMLFTLDTGTSSDAALGEAMVNAIRDLAATKGPHSLVVVTGGADSCNPDAGELIRQEVERAGIRLQIFMVGFKVEDEEEEAVRGLVDELSGGAFVNATDRDMLANVLTAVQNHVQNPASTTAEDIRAAATPAVTTGGYESQTACDHPYLPLRPGATWTYSNPDTGGNTETVDSVSGDLNSASATVTYCQPASCSAFYWTCTGDGLMEVPASRTDPDDYYTVTGQSGAILLPPGELTPGATWNSSFSFETKGVLGEWTYTHTAGEKQSISTSLGSFNVIPVVINITYWNAVLGQTGTTSSTTTTRYYGYGVGIVRIESSYGEHSSTTELVSYYIPK